MALDEVNIVEPVSPDEQNVEDDETHILEEPTGEPVVLTDDEKLAKAIEIQENMQKALKETRGKSKATIDALRRRMSVMEEQLTKATEAKDDDEVLKLLEDYNPDDIVTVAAFKEMVEGMQARFKKQLGQVGEYINNTSLEIAENTFRDSHTDYDEITEPFKDQLRDPEFAKKMLSEGFTKAPRKFYEYCKKSLTPTDIEDKVRKEVNSKLTPVKKPGTMDKTSRKSPARDITKMSLLEKRKAKLTPDELDKLWEETF